MIKMTGNEQEQLVRDTKKEARWIPGFRRRRAHKEAIEKDEEQEEQEEQEEKEEKEKDEGEEDDDFVLMQGGDYL